MDLIALGQVEPAFATPNSPAPKEEVRSELGVQTTMSECEQFRIAGSENSVRAALSILASQTKRDIQKMLKNKDEWKIPISIILIGKPGDPFALRSVVFNSTIDEIKGLNFTIYLHLAQGLNEIQFRAVIIKALLLERFAREEKNNKQLAKLLIRPWLVEGFAEALDWKSGKRDRRLYQLLFQAGELYSFDELLTTSQAKFDAMDGAMTSAFQASAGSLVMALIEQPGGEIAFTNLLSEAAGFNGDMAALLTKHFPKLNLSNKSLEKWWSLQMANLGRSSLGEVLSIHESENALIDALQIQFPAEEGKNQSRNLAEWEKFLELDDALRIAGVRHAQQKIVRLSYRCFPSYRHLLQEYQAILHSLITKKSTDSITSKLAELANSRSLMMQKYNRAIDYLDWYEITRARETTGAFNNYINTKQRIDQTIHRKSDHVSRYLDKAQKLYERKLSTAKKTPSPSLPR